MPLETVPSLNITQAKLIVHLSNLATDLDGQTELKQPSDLAIRCKGKETSSTSSPSSASSPGLSSSEEVTMEELFKFSNGNLLQLVVPSKKTGDLLQKYRKNHARVQENTLAKRNRIIQEALEEFGSP